MSHTAQNLRIMHISESLRGGPASYLEETLPFQVQYFGPRNVLLLAPAQHRTDVSQKFDGIVTTFDRTGRNLTSLVRLREASKRTIREFQPDIIHLHSSFAGAALRYRPLKDSRARIVYCAHGWSFDPDRHTRARRIFALLERRFSKNTNAIICISPHENRFLDSYGFASDRRHLIVSGIADVGAVEEERAPIFSTLRQVPPDSLKLLFLGRTDYQKGFDVLIKEMSSVARTKVHLIVAGAGVIQNTLIKQQDNITWLGWINRKSVHLILEKCDALIMPSRWEGMPLAALEAFRQGKPVIASNRGPFPYLIENGVNGYLFDLEKPGFLQRIVERLSPQTILTMGANARRRYEVEFRSDRMNEKLVELYQQIVRLRP